jgi:branched-chain amino acid transport system substrate-binding protein
VASAGVDDKYGVELAAEIVNGRFDLELPLAREEGLPNLGGARLGLVVADHQGKPEVAQAEAERLITQEKVVALIGAYQSQLTATASQVAERFGIPFVNPESAAPSLTERGFKWFFRVGPHEGTAAKNMFELLKALERSGRARVRTIGIVYENTLYGTDAYRADKQYAQEYGYEVAVEVAYPANTTDVSSEVQRIKAANPDVLFMASYLADAVLFLRTFKRLDFNPQMILAHDGGFADPDYVKTAGKDGDFIITRNAWSVALAEKKPVAKAANDLFRARYGRDMSDVSARSFTALLVLADAINRAGSTDPEAIRRALLATDIPGERLITHWQGVKFDEKTHQNIHASWVFDQVVDGRYYTVWPPEVAVREIVWPMPRWSQRQ